MVARSKKPRPSRSAKSGRRVVKGPQVRPGAKPGKGSVGGRPPIEFDEAAVHLVEDLSRYGNTERDIATILGISVSTLERRFRIEDDPVSIARRSGLANRRDSLLRAQYALALRGNATMQIWLGKQDLGQRDYRAIEVSGPGGKPLDFGGGELLELATAKVLELIRSRTERPRPAAAEGR